MRTTMEGIGLVKQFEGCALRAYQDQEGIWTIGWGRTHHVKPEDTCTQEQADAWLLEDLSAREAEVLACLPPVPAPGAESPLELRLTDNQLSALVSFYYNVGPGKAGEKDGFRVLKSGEPSTMLKCLLEGDLPGAAQEFTKWVYCGGRRSDGLLRRRIAEQALFQREV